METIQQTSEQEKIKALTAYIKSTDNDASDEDSEILINNGDYLVLTDDEADKLAKEYILDTAWAFRYEFLCAHSDAIAEIPKKEYEDMAGKLCESFNKAVLAMIDDKEHFVKDAILSDGRGHFLSQYDGEENEIKINGTYYFIYRCN